MTNMMKKRSYLLKQGMIERLTMDVTIQKGRSLPKIKKCSDCCSNFHCPFCGPKWFKSTKPSKVKIHLQTHFNRTVEHEGYSIHRCHRNCRTHGHYHCLYCDKTVIRKEDIIRHLNICNCKKLTERSTTFTTMTPATQSTADLTTSALSGTAATIMPVTADTPATVTVPPIAATIPTLATLATAAICAAATPDTADGNVPAVGMDITIQRGCSLPEIKRCVDCCSNFHCPFCAPKFFKSAKLCRVQTHLQTHFNRSVEHEGYTIHRCGRSCRAHCHYHCLYCDKTVIRKEDFIRHLDVCNCNKQTESATTMRPATTAAATKRATKRRATSGTLSTVAANMSVLSGTSATATIMPVTADTPATVTMPPIAATIPTPDTAASAPPAVGMDITIQKGRSLPEIKRCVDCCSNFHCPFCAPKFFKSAKLCRVQTHLQTHFNRSVEHEGYTIHRCGRSCRTHCHYHCLYCDKTVIRKEDFIRHLDVCNCNKQTESATTMRLATTATAPKRATKRRATATISATMDSVATIMPTTADTPTTDSAPATADTEGTAATPAPANLDIVVSTLPAVVTDITIQKGRSLPEIKKCSDCCSLFHCPFCAPKWFKSTKPCRVQMHLQIHFKRSVEHEGYTIHRCGRSCRNHFHYHCLYCDKTVIRKRDFMRHLQLCNQSPSAAISTPAEKIRIRAGQYPLQKCPDCHLTIYRKNFKLHIKRKHTAKQVNVTPSSYFKSECVDQINGLYAVHRSFRGASIPLHVQLKLWGERRLACDSSECQSHMELAWRSGQDSYQCSHLKSLSYCKTFLTSPSLKPELLPEVVKHKMFRKEKMRPCIDRQILAQDQNIPLSVESEIGVPPSKKFISVYEPIVSFYSRLGRIMVSYDSNKSYWYCPCSRKKKSCVHICIAKWHLFQTRPQLFRKVPRVWKNQKEQFQVSAVEEMGVVTDAGEVCSFSQSHSTIDETESCLLFIPTIEDFQ